MIDSHIHIMPERRTRGLVRWIKRAFPGHPSSEEMTADDILADVEACGTTRAFNLVFPLAEEETPELNEFSRDIAAQYPQLVPFGSVHLQTSRKDEVAEHCLTALGLAGIKLHPYAQRFEAFCRDFEPLYAKLDELGRPFLVHTGFDAFYQRTQDLGYLHGMLERYPGMPVVLVHALFPRFKLAYELMGEFPQLYLDMTNVPGTLKLYRAVPEVAATQGDGDVVARESGYFEGLLEDFSARIMFGTDHPVGMGSPEQIYADLDSFHLEEKVREDLVGGTAARLLASIGF